MLSSLNHTRHSVDAFESSILCFSRRVQKEFFNSGMGGPFRKRVDTSIEEDFSDEAIKFSYLYHSKAWRVRGWLGGAAGEAEARRMRNDVMSF